MFVNEIRRAVEAAPKHKLPEVAAVMWRAFGLGQVTEAEAEELSGLIEARKVLAAAQTATSGQKPLGAALPRRGGSRPRTDASMERRRRWLAAGRLPPQIAARYTLAQHAVMAVIAAETARRGDCRLCHAHIAALAGVSRSTVRATIRHARALGHVTVEERRLSAWRNDSSIVRIVSREWLGWLRLVRRRDRHGGDISASPTSTNLRDGQPRRPSETAQKASEQVQHRPLRPYRSVG